MLRGDKWKNDNASDYIPDLIRDNSARANFIKLALIEGENSGKSKLSIQYIIQH
jgi:hypothetical protein